MTPLECCDYASDLLRQVGFEFVRCSLKSTSTYYALPPSDKLIRVSTHSIKKEPIGLTRRVYGRITFSRGQVNKDGHYSGSKLKVQFAVASAIGIYLMKTRGIKMSAT